MRIMKSLFTLFITVFIAGSLFTSCNEKIDLIGDFTETAVVYSLLDQSDTIHYVKINRAFIGPGNSLEIAQIPDSNYFDQIDAKITEFVGGIVTREWVLQDTLIENKETNGVFYAPTQKLYYFKTTSAAPLNVNGTYHLNISVNNGQFVVEGLTELVSGISSTADAQNFRFDFADNPGSFTQKGIAVSVGKSYIINTTLEVNFEEIKGATADTTIKSFKWKLGEAETTPNSSKTFTINGQSFYELVKSNATSNSLITKRRLKSIKVINTGGAEDFYNYLVVNQPSSTLAQSKPTYTNLTVSGDYRVVGIFSARYTQSKELFYINPSNSSLRMMTVKSVIELCTGGITGELFFCSQHPGDLSTSYSCQ